MTTTKPKSKRGFGSMDPERHREVTSKGGKAAAPGSRSFSRDRALAVAAGSKGGKSVPDAKRTFSRDRDLAVAAGRKGGLAKKKGRSP